MKKIGFLLVVLLLQLNATFAGGPWPQKKGSLYTQLGFYAIPPTNALFGYKPLLNRPVLDMTAQLYGEYGISDRFTLLTNIPLKFVATGDLVDGLNYTLPVKESGQLIGLSNIALAGKYNILNKKFFLSGELGIEAPTGMSDSSTFLRTGYDTWSFAPSLSIGKSGKKWYSYLSTGVALRTNGFSHQLLSDLEFGYNIYKGFHLALAFNFKYSLNEVENLPNEPVQDLHTALYINNQDYLAWTLKASVPFNQQWGMNASFSGAFWGNNVKKSPSIGLSVYYKWSKDEKNS